MTSIYKTSIVVTFVSALLLVSALALTLTVSAQEEAVQTVEVTNTQEVAEVNETEAVQGSYDFVAQPGDSYTQMARKAVQIYGIETQTNLSTEQIVFVETNLTQAAGSPALEIGQKVTLSKALVSEWVAKAITLTDAQKAAWHPYTIGVDFNTNSVGE